jgi:fucose 4-O-acetylase-like acetyltransferase
MRDLRIDLLRFIGISLIIFAHTSPPSILFQMRNFDVPLMVVLSGMSFSLSGMKSSYFEYIFGRFKRLVLPVWSFLLLFFMCRYFFGAGFELKETIGSFLLVGGIGFVWIIKVFFGVAILSPVLIKLREGANKFLI